MGSPERRRKHPKMMKIASDDILMSILSRNPAKSVIRFRCVSKHWFSLTHDPYFLAMHLRNSPDQHRRHPCIAVKDDNDDNSGRHQLRLYSLNDNACTLTNTITTNCFYSLLPATLDGLICLASHTDVTVLNPTTNESITVTLPDHGSRSESDTSFGFDPVSRKYKLVHVAWPKGKLYFFDCRIEVFAVGPSESWRSRGSVPYILTSAPTCVSGVVYWMCIWLSSAAGRGIAAFDLSDEQFRVVKPPEWRRDSLEVRYIALNEGALNWRRDSHEMQALHEWDGKLCFLSYHGFYEKPDLINIWVLTDCTRNDWAKMYSISLAGFPYHGSVNLVRMSEENALLSIGRTRLFYYYFPTKTWRVIDDFETKTATTIQAYLQTLTPISL